MTEVAKTPRKGAITPRQVELLCYLVKGMTQKEIARKVGISYRSVESTLERLRKRHGLRNRLDMAVWSLRAGVVPLDPLPPGVVRMSSAALPPVGNVAPRKAA